MPQNKKAEQNLKTSEKRRRKMPKIPKGQPFWRNLLSTFLIFLVIIAIYSLIDEGRKQVQEIPISLLAREINEGAVAGIVVKGEELEITYTDGEEKKSKKEAGTALTDTFVNYGVSLEKLREVEIDIKGPGGFRFWLANLAPFLIPVIFIIFFIWFLSRQVKGAGMQAFSFGQSKARMIDPKDKNQRVTFADVAGAKEAKEELIEIVDFLKNPKKFLDIGARIPKGVILMGMSGTGKCIVGDSLILTNKGLIEIKDIPKYFWVDPESNKVEGAYLPTFDIGMLNDDERAASHWYDLGEQLTKKITLKQGMLIEGTREHPIIVMDINGELIFKKLGELQVGDLAAVKFDTNIFGTSAEVTADQAYIMGLLTGDGNLSHSSRIGFTTKDKELAHSFTGYVKEHYKATAINRGTDGITYNISSWNAKRDFYKAGMSYLLSYDKVIPPSILQAPKETVVSFLQGLFDTDGYFERYNFGYATVSKTLSDQVMALLLNLGIVPRRRIKSRADSVHPRPVYEITISGSALPVFAEKVGFRLNRKQKQLCDYLSSRATGNTNVDLFRYIRDSVEKCWEELQRNQLSTEKISNLAYKIKKKNQISRNALRMFLHEFKKSGCTHGEADYLQSILKANLFFSPVAKIDNSISRVYDFTVPGTHSFISNGFISHNTLLARAVAGEAGVPFFSISGSEFVEMFVGVGASRVRDLFRMAKKAAPAIIFVDEIDAVGRVRGTGVGGGNDEREQTLNQILVEMDGFEPNERLVILAATNRPDVLDPALLRPGRFDRRVVIDLPDRQDREEILKIHARKKPFAEDVNLTTIAERTPGFSGADLYSLMNEAAILAAREDRKKISQFDLIRSIEKVMLGPERKSHVLSMREKEIAAYHEAGHALAASVLPYADPVHKVSIISRGRAAGYTLKLPFEDRRMQSKKEFLDDIAVSLGGYVTEKMMFDDLTTGASNDLQVLSALARDMVTKYGMSEKMGPVALEGDGGRALFGRGVMEKEYSEKVSAEIDGEVSRIIEDAYKKAEHIIKSNKKALDAIAHRLIEAETIERDEFEKLLIANGITPKKKQDIEHQK